MGTEEMKVVDHLASFLTTEEPMDSFFTPWVIETQIGFALRHMLLAMQASFRWGLGTTKVEYEKQNERHVWQCLRSYVREGISS